MPGCTQALTEVSGAAILPNDGIADRLASLTIPHDRCLSLIRDADSSYISRPEMSLIQDLEGNRDLR